jgi:hypothetical protein
VDIPSPKPAQVLRYAYLWADEHADGREEGTKDRPVAVVLTVLALDGNVRVTPCVLAEASAFGHLRPRPVPMRALWRSFTRHDSDRQTSVYLVRLEAGTFRINNVQMIVDAQLWRSAATNHAIHRIQSWIQCADPAK